MDALWESRGMPDSDISILLFLLLLVLRLLEKSALLGLSGVLKSGTVVNDKACKCIWIALRTVLITTYASL